MRRVWGCISASSAATEIMKTPRSWSIRRAPSSFGLRGPRRGLRSAIARHSPLRPGPSGLAEEPGAGVLAVEGLSQLLDGLALLVGELRRDVDADPVIDVAAARALGVRWPLAAEALDRAVLGSRRDPDRLRAAQGGHLDLCSLDRLRDRDGEVDLEVPV